MELNLKNMNLEQLIDKAGDLAKKIGEDSKLLESFTKDPVKTLESKLGIDLPDEQVKKLADAIKAKLNLDKASSIISGIGKLFG